MRKLTEAQRRELERLRDLKLPASMTKRNYPGFPYTMVDMRSVNALCRLGLVEQVMRVACHTDNPGSLRFMACYRITALGRAALHEDKV